jgi:hypothetical protein
LLVEEPSIVCPQCRTQIKLTETLAAPLIETAKREADAKLKAKEAEIAKREATIRAQADAVKQAREAMDAEVAERMKAERKKVQEEEAKKAAAKFSIDLHHKAQELENKSREFEALNKAYREREAKIEEAIKTQAEAVRKQRELDDAKREFELTVEKKVAESQAGIQQRAKAEAEQVLSLKVQEKEQTILAMQKQIEELKRKSEQGSQQLQGEVQELQLEALLRASFPHDTITPVPKGEFGGDALHEVATPFGQACGKILWESKRTRNWSDGWLPKLRSDQRAAKADAAIIVSQAMPKSIDDFGQIEGIWITKPKFAVALALAVRHGLIEVAMARKSDEGQHSKMEIMYRYLTGPRFKQLVQAMAEKLRDMQADLDRERKAMQKSWAKREQQILGIASATSNMWGDLQGIAGKSLPEIEGLDFDGEDAGERRLEGGTLRLIESDG